jgi:peptidyl-prolyl cis-trans isomerase A (cyclophilin A)
MEKLFDPPAINVPGEGTLRVRITTRLGVIDGILYEDKAPKTVANFVGLATGAITGTPFYDGVIFHRVIPDFMVQAGCPQGRGTGGPGYVIRDEFAPGLRHDRGGLFSMANRGPNTGASQFFLTEVPTPWLDNKHAIFGEVSPEGLAIIKNMAREPRGAGDRPHTEISMQKVEIYRA